MGRESRQARRARERRDIERRQHHHSTHSNKLSIAAAAGIVLVVVLVLVGYAFANRGTGSANNVLTPRPDKTIAGIGCNPTDNGNAYHRHAHLTIVVKGKVKPIPSLIGVRDQSEHQCDYWLHTHDTSGIVHVEAPHVITPKLSAFFAVWNKPLSPTQIGPYAVAAGEHLKLFVNYKPYSGDVRDILLRHHEEITIVIGPPYVAPARFDFAKHNV